MNQFPQFVTFFPDGGAVNVPPTSSVPPNAVPYSFNFSATIRGTDKILRVTSDKDKIRTDMTNELLTAAKVYILTAK